MHYICKTLLISSILLVAVQHLLVNSSTELFLSADDQRIHIEADSMFNLKNPSDLFEFLDQEERVKSLRSLEKSLDKLRAHLDELISQEDEDIDIEKLILKHDADCQKAGDLYKKLNLLETVVLTLEAKGFRTENFISTSRAKIPLARPSPNCSQVIDVDSTTGILNNLKGYQNRRVISTSPEAEIIAEVTAGLTANEFGYAVIDAMQKNSSSWILFNMAAFYYRITGDASMGLECARRALHFAPRQHKDVAMISIASMLFRADYSRDALAVTRAALEISGESAAVYTLMGFISASISKFDDAVEAFSGAIRLNKRSTKLLDYRYAIKCHAKVHKGLSDQHKGLQEVIRQFEKIGTISKEIDAVMAAVYSTKVPSAGVLLRTYGFISAAQSHTFEADGSYAFGKQPFTTRNWITGINSINLESPTKPPKFYNVYVPDVDYYFLSNDWPTAEECRSHITKNNAPYKTKSVLMLVENKGFEFWNVVGDLKPPSDFPLPFCETKVAHIPLGLFEMLQGTQRDDLQRFPEAEMQNVISNYMKTCNSMKDFGRIVTLAHISTVLPSWMYFNMAAVYWRAAGDTTRAAECLARAYVTVPSSYKDVVLINLASFFNFLNDSESALTMVREAVDITALEPVTLFTMGNILSTHGFTSLAIKNYRLTLTQDVSFHPAVEALRRSRCVQIASGAIEKPFSAETLLESLGSGIIEIGIIDTKSGLHIVKRTSENAAKTVADDPGFSQRLKVALNDLKTPKKQVKQK